MRVPALGLCLLAQLCGGVRLKFERYNGGLVSVRDELEDSIKCTDEGDKMVMQLDADSVLVEGAVRGRPTPLNDYGVRPFDEPGETAETLLLNSGMFIPELDPCWDTEFIAEGESVPGNVRRSGSTYGWT